MNDFSGNRNQQYIETLRKIEKKNQKKTGQIKEAETPKSSEYDGNTSSESKNKSRCEMAV